MVNLRNIGQKFTKDETKELLEKSKEIIDKKILGDNFKRNDLIKKKELKKKVKVKAGEEETVETLNGELVTTVKTKTKIPVSEEYENENKAPYSSNSTSRCKLRICTLTLTQKACKHT